MPELPGGGSTAFARAKMQLNYTQATDLFANPGVAVTPQAWTQWLAPQSFNVERAGSLLLFVCRQSGAIYTGDQQHNYVIWRFNIDSGATTEKFGELLWNQSASVPMSLQGGSAFVSGLSVGAHTVGIDYYSVYPTDYPSHTKGLIFLRPTATVDSEGSSAPWISTVEYLRLQAIELG